MLFVTNSKRAAASLVLFTATAIDLHLTHLHRESKAKWLGNEISYDWRNGKSIFNSLKHEVQPLVFHKSSTGYSL